ncbi:MAG: amidohydrolase family protein [Thermoanaerobaculia bacterium]
MRAPVRESLRRALLVGVWALLVAAEATAYEQVPGAAQARPVLLRGGALYTVAQGVLPATDLLFDDGKIVAIGPGLSAPAGAEVLDLAGARVYPGLIAAATTLGLVEIDAVRATRDTDETGDLNPEVVARTAYNPDSELIPTVRSAGITTVQVAPAGQLVRGRSSILHLDGWTVEDAGVEAVGGLFLSWPPSAVVHSSFMPVPAEEQEKEMKEQRRRLRDSFDAARAYDRARDAGEPLEIDQRWEAMRPLWDGSLPVYVEADDARQILEAIDFADDYGLAMVLVGGAEAHRVTDLLAARDIPVLLDTPNRLPYRDEDGVDAQFRQPALLAAAGVRFALAPIGASWGVRNLALEGAGLAIQGGLAPEAGLRAVTLTPAEILGIADREGSLEVGKDATLIVSSGDVTDTLGHRVTHMFIQGRPVDLDNKQRALYRKYAEKVRRAAGQR